MFLDAVVRRRRFVVFAALCILALGVLTDQVRSPDKRRVGWIGVAVQAAVAPLATGLSRISDVVDREWAFVTEIGRLRIENARLTAEVSRLREENAQLHDAAQEAARTRSLLGFKTQHVGNVLGTVFPFQSGHRQSGDLG